MTDPRLMRPLWRGRTNVDAMTIACIEHAEDIVRRKAPAIAHPFVITQGSYQPAGEGAAASATTHYRGGVVDADDCGHDVCYLALREAGTAAYRRTAAEGPWRPHYHLIVIGHPDLDPMAARQVESYFRRCNALKNDGPDTGPRLDPIPRPVWPYPQEDIVTPEDIQKIAAETVEQLLAAKVAKEGPTVKAALRMGSKAAGIEDRVAARVGQLLLDGRSDVAATVTAAQIEAAVKQALREGTGD